MANMSNVSYKMIVSGKAYRVVSRLVVIPVVIDTELVEQSCHGSSVT